MPSTFTSTTPRPLALSSAIRGAATIGRPPPNTSGLGHVINNGLISANTSGQSMAILVQDFTNNGTLEAINGGLLTLNNLVGNANTIRASGTKIDADPRRDIHAQRPG